MRILVTDGMDQSAVAALRADGHEVVEQFFPPEELGAALREFDVAVVRSKTKVRKNHIDEALGGKLKLIIRGGVVMITFAERNTENDMEYTVYCDETCHLEHDNIKPMALGAVWCPKEAKDEIFKRLREIKIEHGLKPTCELKWNAVSSAKLAYYIDVINYFFDNQDLHFRTVIVPDKSVLNLSEAKMSHDSLYYKLYFDLLKTIIEPKSSYYIYLDIKDTKSQDKVENLQTHLNQSHYDFDRNMVKRIQQVRSHEIELVGLADFLVGAICYVHRGLQTSTAKLAIIEKIRERSGYNLLQNTLYKEDKMNIFIWKGVK